MRLSRALVFTLATATLLLPLITSAQSQSSDGGGTVTPETQTIELAQVTAVSNEQVESLPGTGTNSQEQTLTADILSGPDKGERVSFENDYIQLNVGDTFYAMHTTSSLDGTDYWSVSDPYRLNILEALGALFLFLIV